VQQFDPDLRALQEVRDFVTRAHAACEAIHGYSQAQIDALCKAASDAAARSAYDLAKLAVEETGIGRVHYKILKNLFASEGTWASIKDEKTVGVIARDPRKGLVEVATAVGVVAGIIPTTNPTSTAIFKSLIALKGKNAIVISPHPRARRCIGESVEVMRRAIERAGGPPDLLLSLTNPTIESTGALMKHKHVAVILATGGTGLVRAAYSSGKPAYGVGPGNVPCYVDRSADVALAARTIVQSQSFDNGTFCCSEQALVLDKPIEAQFLAEIRRAGAHLCNEEETRKLAALCNRGGHMNPDVVGQDPWKLAEWAGFKVARETTLLLAYQGGVGPKFPLSIEILAPVLSVHVVDGWREGCAVSMETLHSDGLGHTCAVWARDEQVLEAWFLEKPANRIIVNGPSSQGAVGYSTNLVPSVSLGCGPQAGNITSDNISAKHLVNIKRVAYPRADWETAQLRDHERAARMGGEAAPRGSLLPGDPALGGGGSGARSSAFAAPAASNWQGNASMMPPRASANPSAPAPTFSTQKVQAAAKSPAGQVATSAGATPATTFTSNPMASAVSSPLTGAGSAPRAASANFAGGALSPGEIQSMMSHAGAGCPLGPCKGCQHHNVATGACHA
jgi:acyl-CoA reductase-like NAD-dependent aldehyde dehydrogenase